jgi:hypothetical protein
MSDDLYFDGIKIKSSFRPVMVNQPSADRYRVVIQSQINKFSVENSKRYILVIFMLFLASIICILGVHISGIVGVNSFREGFNESLFSLVFNSGITNIDRDFRGIISGILFSV